MSSKFAKDAHSGKIPLDIADPTILLHVASKDRITRSRIKDYFVFVFRFNIQESIR
jgi:hypothetical protein